MNKWMNASLQLKNLRHHPSTVTWPEPRDKSSSTSWWSLECLLIFSVYIQPCLRFRSTRCLCRTCLLVTAGSIMKVLISKFCFFLSFLCGHTDIQQTLKGPLFLVGGEQAFVLIGCEQTVYHTGVETSLGLLTVNAAHYAFRHTDLADMKQVHLLNDTILTCWIKHIAEGQGGFFCCYCWPTRRFIQ